MLTLHVFPPVVPVSSASQVTGEGGDLLYEPLKDFKRNASHHSRTVCEGS